MFIIVSSVPQVVLPQHNSMRYEYYYLSAWHKLYTSALMFQKCQVLYEDDVWYDGTVTGIEFCDEKKQWMYKILFSDGETTLAARDDPEVCFPF